MKTIKEMKISLVEDRNILKWNVQLMTNGKIYGFIKPVR